MQKNIFFKNHFSNPVFCAILHVFGALAQLGARHTGSVEATGSSPVCSIKMSRIDLMIDTAYFCMIHPESDRRAGTRGPSTIRRAADSLQQRTDIVINCAQQRLALTAFCSNGDDGRLIRQYDGKLGIFAIGPERIIFTAPKKIAIRIRTLLACAFFNPFFGEQLPAVPVSLI